MSLATPPSPRCSRCGAPLNGAADGLCTRCLLTGALIPPLETEPVEMESPATLLARKEFAGYELLGEIARGGMGIVFRARQKRPERTVALKIIATGELASTATVERFRTEAEAAARLDHPGIVPIYEVGQHGTWHFFSMRLIEGPTLGRAIDGKPMPPEAAAKLMAKIARAVHHAHQRGILHRDLKPNNILLDAKGEPHLTDFGLAKLVESGLSLTQSDMVLGTPAYMAPEQAAGGSRDLTVAVDVYGLGAVFYEMLTGRPPFEAPSIHLLLKMVAEEEPRPPSYVHRDRRKSALIRAADSAYRKRRGIDHVIASSAATNALLADLDVICLKCLEKDPAQRYRSADELADDLERALRHESIAAKPSTATQRVRKWARRNPIKVAFAVSVLALLVAGTTISTWQAVRATRAEKEQSRLRRDAEAQAYAADINLAEQSLAANNFGRAHELLLRHRSPSDQDLRGWEWRYLWQHARSDAEKEFVHLPNSITSLAVSSDGRWLAVGQIDGGGLVVYDVPNHTEVYRAASPFQRVMTAFSPRAPLLAFSFTTGESDREKRSNWVRLWNAEQRQVVGDIPIPARCERLRFSADGEKLLLAAGSELTLWRVSDQKQLGRFVSDAAAWWTLDAAGDLSLATCAAEKGGLRLVDLTRSNVLWTVPAADDYIIAVALSPDRTMVASAAGFAESSIRLWDAASGRELARLDGHVGYVHDLRFVADGKTLISASSDQTIRLWDIETRRQVGVLRGHRQEVWSQTLLPDQRTLISGAKDGSVLVWNLDRVHETRGRTILSAPARGWTFGADGKTILLGENSGVISEWSGADFQQRRVLHDFGTNLTRACFTGDGRLVAVELPDRRAVIRDLRHARTLAEISLPPGKSYVREFSPDGSHLFLDNSSGEDFHAWNVASNALVQTWRISGSYNIGGAQSHDGRWRVVVNGLGHGIARDLIAQTNRNFALEIVEPDASAFSPDNKILAVASLRGLVHLYEWPSLREAGTLRGFLQGAHWVTFSPDGRRVAGGSNGRQAVKIWDVPTQRELITLDGNGSIFSRIQFSENGNLVGARSQAGLVHIWRAPSYEEIAASTR
jgi:serine/threonine protein kinase/WD40 repeat protein